MKYRPDKNRQLLGKWVNKTFAQLYNPKQWMIRPINKLAIRFVERGICPIAKFGVKYDIAIVFLSHNFQ